MRRDSRASQKVEGSGGAGEKMGSRGAWNLGLGVQIRTVCGARILGGRSLGGVSIGLSISSRGSLRERSFETKGMTTRGNQIEM